MESIKNEVQKGIIAGSFTKSVTVSLVTLNSTGKTMEAMSQKRDHRTWKSIAPTKNFTVSPQTMKVPGKKWGSGFQRFDLKPDSWAASFCKPNRRDNPSGIVVRGDVTYVTVSTGFFTKMVTQTVTIYATAINNDTQPVIKLNLVGDNNGHFQVNSSALNNFTQSSNKFDVNDYHKVASYVTEYEESINEEDADQN